MKIYTKIEFEWERGQLAVSHEESYEHDGDTALCKGGAGNNHVEESPHAKELSRIAKEKWDWYQQHFAPLENEYMENTKASGSRSEFDRGAGNAMTAASSGLTALSKQKDTEMLSSGVRAGSGMHVMSGVNRSSGAGRSVGRAGSAAGMGMKDRFVSKMEGIVGMGQGQSSGAIKSMADITGQALQKSKDDAFSAWNDKNSTRKAVSAGLGMVAGYMEDDE